MFSRLINQLVNMSPAQHRTVQSCAVACFCLGLIVWCLGVHGDDLGNTIAARALDWSFVVLLGVVGIYHGSSVVANLHTDSRTTRRRQT